MSLDEKKPGLSINVIPQRDFIHDSDNLQKIVEVLNHALADEALLSIKTRNAKWNLFGPGFFELSSLYEIYLNQTNYFSDEITKRIHTLHGQPIATFSEYIAFSRLTETPGVTPNLSQLLADHESVIHFFHEDYQKCTKFYEDTSTSELIKRIIRQHEKITRMLRSFIQKKQIHIVHPAVC